MIALDDMTADALSNKRLEPTAADSFLCGRKLILFFIKPPNFGFPKNV